MITSTSSVFARCYRFRCALAGFVAVQHQNGLPEVVLQKIGLIMRQVRSHQPDHVAVTGLVYFDRIEEAFDYDDAAAAECLARFMLKRTCDLWNPAGNRYFGSSPFTERPAYAISS